MQRRRTEKDRKKDRNHWEERKKERKIALEGSTVNCKKEGIEKERKKERKHWKKAKKERKNA